MWNRKQILFLIACGIGFLSLLWSAYDYFALMGGSRIGASFCSVNSYWNCDQATMSSLGSWQNIPIGLAGAAWFLVVAVLGLVGSEYKFIRRFVLLLGVLTVSYLFYVLTFRMHVGCIICFISYACILSVVFLGWSPSGFSLSKRAGSASLAFGLLGLLLFGAIGRTMIDSGKFSEEEFQKWFQNVEVVPTSSKLTKGSDTAKIIVAEFSDFGCPYCAVAAETLLPYLAEQPDVKVFYYPFPLDNTCNASLKNQVHPHSCDWAKGAICANEQDKLWPYHNKIFKLAKDEGHLPALFPAVESFDLEMTAFRECMKKPETGEELQKLIAVSTNLNITSTPSFIVGGRRYEGFIPMPLLRRVLEELRRGQIN